MHEIGYAPIPKVLYKHKNNVYKCACVHACVCVCVCVSEWVCERVKSTGEGEIYMPTEEKTETWKASHQISKERTTFSRLIISVKQCQLFL